MIPKSNTTTLYNQTGRTNQTEQEILLQVGKDLPVFSPHYFTLQFFYFMKKVFQISIMLVFAVGFAQSCFGQNFTGNNLCCHCCGKGSWYSTYLDANSNVQILETKCNTCWGSGKGTCKKSDIQCKEAEKPKSQNGFYDPYYDNLLKEVQKPKSKRGFSNPYYDGLLNWVEGKKN